MVSFQNTDLWVLNSRLGVPFASSLNMSFQKAASVPTGHTGGGGGSANSKDGVFTLKAGRLHTKTNQEVRLAKTRTKTKQLTRQQAGQC